MSNVSIDQELQANPLSSGFASILCGFVSIASVDLPATASVDLPVAYKDLPVVSVDLPVACLDLPIASVDLPVAYVNLSVASVDLPVAYYVDLPVASGRLKQ